MASQVDPQMSTRSVNTEICIPREDENAGKGGAEAGIRFIDGS